MKKTEKEYHHLVEAGRDIRILEGIHSILDWDQETYMPEAAAGIRAEQFKTLAGIIHKKKTSGTFPSRLDKMIDLKTGKVRFKDLTEEQAAALKEWRRDYLIEKALPKSFVENWAKLTSQSIHAWKHAREQNAFQQFSPYLEQIVSMSRKKAELLGYSDHPYDALLDLYEPEAKTKQIAMLFGKLREALIALLKTIKAKKPVDDHFLFGKFSADEQIKFSKILLEKIGYDSARGRLDLSTHPFSSSSHPTDSRITSRIHATGLMNNISSVMHEAGHAFYEMGLPIEHYGTPLGDARSLGIHESQSRWWETLIGHSRSFWSHFLPILQGHFGQIKGVSLDQFYQAVNKVSPGLIRVEADEVTYCLHIILRFELECDLITEKLDVKDLPEAWKEKMQELLGVTPETNRDGCLQDIHWSMGAFGYFPTYALGNLYAAHLFEGFANTHHDWEKRIAQGEFDFMKQWLHENVHQHGRRYPSLELLKKATGKTFSEEAYINYLNHKYR